MRVSERSQIISLLVVVCGVSSAALAQVDTGDVELRFTGSLGWATSSIEGQPGVDGWSVNAGIGAGFFVSPHVDVGGIVGLGYSEFDTGHSYQLTLGPEANYHFRPHSNVVPFVGGGFGYFYNETETEFPFGGRLESSSEGWYGEVHAGADFFLNRNVSIKLLMVYRHSRAHLKGAQVFTSDLDEIFTAVGLAFFFR
jgi:hypothetical protein